MKTIDERLEVIDAFQINRESGNVDIFGRNNKSLYHMVNDLNDGKTLSEEKIAKPSWYNFPEEWDFGYATYSGDWIRFAPWFTTGVEGIWPLVYKATGKGNLLDDIRSYEHRVCGFREELFYRSMRELEKSVEDVKLYQGPIDEVSEQVGKRLELVDLGTPETFLRVDNKYNSIEQQGIKMSVTPDFMLRFKAKNLGANAVVHYMPGSSMGTPVRFFDDKK